MHKMKNKRIMSIILGGLVAITATRPYIYANELTVEKNSSVNLASGENVEDKEDNNEGVQDNNENIENDVDEEEIVSINLIEVNNEENLGKKVKVSGEVESIKDGVIIIKDLSGKATLFLNNIENKEIKIGDSLTVIGKIENINNSKYVVIYNDSDIEIKNDIDKEDGKEDNDDNLDNKEEDKKPDSNNQSSSQVKPNQSTNTNNQQNSGNINSNSQNNTVTSVKKIYARSYITISNNLTSAQWEKVKTALSEGTIKVVDLPNNKIRIKYVSNGYGDKVWIVNDPRGLDEEVEEKVKTIGLELAKSISYSDYDISKSNWDTILEKIENGTAKLKIVDDKNLKVIYNKNGKADTTKIIEKK